MVSLNNQIDISSFQVGFLEYKPLYIYIFQLV